MIEINESTNKLVENAKKSMSDKGDLSQIATMLQMMVSQFGGASPSPSSNDDTPVEKEVDVDLF